jgi:hypothetical protein
MIPISSLSAQQFMVKLVYNELERMLCKNCITLTFAQIHTTMWVSFLAEFNYTSEPEDAIPLIWLQNSVVGMEQEWKFEEGIWILMGNFWKKCAEDVRDARTTQWCILEKKAVTVAGNWFSIEDSSLLECDAVLLDESSPWRWRQYDTSKGHKLLVQSQSIISYPIFSKEPQILHGSLLCLVALVMLKPTGSTRVCS